MQVSDAAAAIALRRTRSLTGIVQRELERMILSGELAAGERLNEQLLAARLGVSRGPIREATRALERAGLVSAIVNHGVFVREIDLQEAKEIYDVRAVVFGFACARVARIGTEEQKAELAGLVRHMDDAVARADKGAYYKLNLSFHDAVMACADHRRASQVYDSLIKETHLLRQRALDSVPAMRESNAEHAAIVAAIRDSDGERARVLGEQHALGGKRRWLASRDGDAHKQ
jgi:DNA-binding GntR family transcriptional regulator